MKALDTNVVLRYLLQDDKAQAAKANRLIAHLQGPGGPAYISLATMMEVAWVLRSRYRKPIDEVCATLDLLLSTESFLVQNEDEIFSAISLVRAGLGSFEDALIGMLGQWSGCTCTLTFDRKASRLPGFELIA